MASCSWTKVSTLFNINIFLLTNLNLSKFINTPKNKNPKISVVRILHNTHMTPPPHTHTHTHTEGSGWGRGESGQVYFKCITGKRKSSVTYILKGCQFYFIK